MRRSPLSFVPGLALALTLTITLGLAAVSPALAAAAKPARAADVSDVSGAPDPAQLREYVRLFGYRQMLAEGAERQLSAIIELAKQSRTGVAPGIFDLIHKELTAELNAALEQAVTEMTEVLGRHFTREDVAYLVGIGRDPRMQAVVAKQPAIGADLESVGERLAERVTQRAAPRIEERLRQLEGAQQL